MNIMSKDEDEFSGFIENLEIEATCIKCECSTIAVLRGGDCPVCEAEETAL